MKRLGFSILCLLALLAMPTRALADPPFGPSLVIQNAGTRVGAHTLNFSTGITGSMSGSTLTLTVAGGGTVTSVTANGGITSSGGNTPNLTLGGTDDMTLSTGSMTYNLATTKTMIVAGVGGTGALIDLKPNGATWGRLLLDTNGSALKWAGSNAVVVNSTAIQFNGASQSMTYSTASGELNCVTDFGCSLGDHTHRFGAQTYMKRLSTEGTTPVNSDFALTGWGNTASVGTISGDDTHLLFTVTSAGTGQAGSPTIVYTFKDGTWTQTPFCWGKLEASNDIAITVASAVTDTENATTMTLTLNNPTSPTAAKTYTFSTFCQGG